MKTPTDRAAEAIEAAELLFSKKMGATLNLGPAANEAVSTLTPVHHRATNALGRVTSAK